MQVVGSALEASTHTRPQQRGQLHEWACHVPREGTVLARRSGRCCPGQWVARRRWRQQSQAMLGTQHSGPASCTPTHGPWGATSKGRDVTAKGGAKEQGWSGAMSRSPAQHDRRATQSRDCRHKGRRKAGLPETDGQRRVTLPCPTPMSTGKGVHTQGTENPTPAQGLHTVGQCPSICEGESSPPL